MTEDSINSFKLAGFNLGTNYSSEKSKLSDRVIHLPEMGKSSQRYKFIV